MKKIKVGVKDLIGLKTLIGEVRGTLKEFKMAEKLEERFTISKEESDKAGIMYVGQDRINFKEDWKKEIELNDDEIKLIKRTLTEFINNAEESKKKFSDIKNFLDLEEILS